MNSLCFVLLCGGVGSRLWPLSTKSRPKQFIDLGNGKLIENTIDRINKINIPHRKVFITNKQYETYIKDTKGISNINGDIIIYEPKSNNTNPSILISVLIYQKIVDNPETLFVVLPCDHVFDDISFKNQILDGIKYCKNNKKHILTFGISPTYPETGFGYIGHSENDNKIQKFVEKPKERKAKELIENGFLWNSGIFMFYRESIMGEYKTHNSSDLSICEKIVDKTKTDKISRIYIDDDFCKLQNISFDNAIMEKTNNAAVLKYDGYWNDVGDWNKLSQIFDKNGEQNKISPANTNIMAENSKNNIIHSDIGSVVAIDVDNLAIIRKDDKLFVSKLESANKIKNFMSCKAITNGNRNWGKTEILKRIDNKTVKLITINPFSQTGKMISRRFCKKIILVSGKCELKMEEEIIVLEELKQITINKNDDFCLCNKTCNFAIIQEINYLG